MEVVHYLIIHTKTIGAKQFPPYLLPRNDRNLMDAQSLWTIHLLQNWPRRMWFFDFSDDSLSSNAFQLEKISHSLF